MQVQMAKRNEEYVRVIVRCTYYDVDFALYVVPHALIAGCDTEENRDLLQLKPRDSPTDFKLLFPNLFDILWEGPNSDFFCGDLSTCAGLNEKQSEAFAGLGIIYVDLLWLDNLTARRESSEMFYAEVTETKKQPSKDALDAAKFSGLVEAASDEDHPDYAAADKLMLNLFGLTSADIEPFEPALELWTHPTCVPLKTGAVVTWRAPLKWNFEMMSFIPTDPMQEVTAALVVGSRRRPLVDASNIVGGLDRLRALYHQLYGMGSKLLDGEIQPLFGAAEKWLTLYPAIREEAIQDLFSVLAGQLDFKAKFHGRGAASIMTLGVLGLPPVSLVGSTLGGDQTQLVTNLVDWIAVDSTPHVDLAAIASKRCFGEQAEAVVLWNDTDVSHMSVATAFQMVLAALQHRSNVVECSVYVRSADFELDPVAPANNRRHLKRLLQQSNGDSLCGWRCLCIALRRTIHRDCIDDPFFREHAGSVL